LGQKGGALASDRCIACHVENDMLPEGYLEDDVHMQPGLSCAGCHGGDPTSDDEVAAMSPGAGFIGVPTREEIPAFCGRCHSDIDFMRGYQPRIATDQETRYATSIHGQRLVQGDRKVAECASCHTAHGILPAKDARSSVYALNVPATCRTCHGDSTYMKDYGIPTTQYDDYARGVHGVALHENQDTGAPACNDCHDNHGAIPPGITSIRQVCGQCHVNNMQYFTASKMGRAWEERDMHACEECHGNHDIAKTSDHMVGTGDDAVCMGCHSAGERGYAAAAAIRGQLDSLVAVYDEALGRQKRVQTIGMDDVDIAYLLQESHQSLIQSRTLVHTFDPEQVGPKTREGVAKAQEAITLAAAQIEDYHVRRRGFGMATLFITILIVALFLKIRQMESR
jgi:predicted CXXCH cytochrome family protein